MFSGIVEVTSPILKIREAREQKIFAIRRPRGWKFAEGESVSVEGVCSTVQRSDARSFSVVYMPETLRRSTLGGLRVGEPVNLERSLTLSSLIGGHLVQGHVDATGTIGSMKPEGEAVICEIAVPRRLSRYIVEKGSIAVDGISLTVVREWPGRFTVSLLAYTLGRTTLGGKKPGDKVNLEADMIAKYLESLVRK
ncbi:MAG: riboflavin synthase [Deltaproteobacteria bacterium]